MRAALARSADQLRYVGGMQRTAKAWRTEFGETAADPPMLHVSLRTREARTAGAALQAEAACDETIVAARSALCARLRSLG